jgi:tetratricopeptide (TPR) repeat protein
MSDALASRGVVGAACHASEVSSYLGRGEEARATLDAADRRLTLDAGVVRAWVTAYRGLAAEARGDVPAALALYERAIDAPGGTGVRHGRWTLARGRCLLRLGRDDEARERLADAIEWSRRSGAGRVGVLARCHLATRSGGDVLAARVALERQEAEVPVRDRVEAHLALWEATGDAAHLAAARGPLAFLVANAPPEAREAMVESVELHRRAARGERSGA